MSAPGNAAEAAANEDEESSTEDGVAKSDLLKQPRIQRHEDDEGNRTPICQQGDVLCRVEVVRSC